MNLCGEEHMDTCVVVRRVDELGRDLLLVLAELVLGHQPVDAVVDVRGVDQLQTAVVLAAGGVVDHGADVVVLLQDVLAQVPLQLGLGVAHHAEGDAPVVVALGPLQLRDGGGD